MDEPGGGAAPGRPILVVDDDPAIRRMVRDALVDDGYAVVEAADGSQALEVVGHADPRLVLLDMRMPGLDGWGFARLYRERATPPAPLVVMTAARDALAWGQEVGADAVLTKPFELADLDAILDRFCR